MKKYWIWIVAPLVFFGFIFLGLYYEYSDAEPILFKYPILVVPLIVCICGIAIFAVKFDTRKFEHSYEMYNYNVDVVNEIMLNGYTDKVIEESAQLSNKYKDKLEYYSEYRDSIMHIVLAYFYRDDYEEAIKWLGNLNLDSIVKYSKNDIVPGWGITSYFSMWMSIYRALNEFDKAEVLFAEAKNYLEDYVNQDNEVGRVVNEIYYDYYFMKGDYENAQKYADYIIGHYSNSKNSIVSELILAELKKAMGDTSESEKRIKLAEDKLRLYDNGLNRTIFKNIINRINKIDNGRQVI